MPLTIALLGAPRIDVDGKPLQVDTRKAIALLAYLAVTGHAHGRDRLTSLLWPEYDDVRARAALRRTISTLKTALGGGWLRVERSAVALAADGVEIDVRRFRQLVAGADGAQAGIAALREAVALHRDELLAGFGLRDSVEFDDWQQAAAADLRRELGSALDRLASALGAVAEYDEAIAHARRRLALDPLHEPAHRRLIELLAAAGERAEALRQYRDCVRVLDRELGVRPLPETTELYQAVNEGRVASAPLPTKIAALPERRLVGRGGEWQELNAAHAAAATDGRMVALEGEAGIGKTRLAEEFLAHAQARGAVIAAARSHPGEATLTYGLIAEALRAALAATGAGPVEERWLAEAGRLLPELASPHAPPADDGPGAQHRFYEALAQVIFGTLAAPVPGVLFLDDLQWADVSSLEVIAFVARRLTGRRLLILGAWRPEDAAVDHLLRRPLEIASTRVRPGRLSRDDVSELARAAGASADAADRLFGDSEGLPLFVVEYLAALDVEDAVGSLPGGVRSILWSRLQSVTETASQLLAAAAVIGNSFDVETLRDASGRSDEEVVSGLEELTSRGLVVERAHGYDFSHDKLRELVADETSLARSRLLHRRVAEALAARRADPARIALHHRGAGQELEAADAYRNAGERARALYAYGEALEHFTAALALDHPEPAALHEAIGDLHTVRGEYRAALDAYEAAAALGGAERLASIEHKLGRVHDRRGQWELADRHFEAALQLGGDPARIYADRSLAAHHRGAQAEALAFAERALALAEQSRDDEALARAHNMVGMLRNDRDHLERSLALAESFADPSMTIAALNNLALACARRGDQTLALELTTRALALCSRQGDRHREAALHNNLADLLHSAGRSEEAMEHLKHAAARFSDIGSDAEEMQPAVWMLVEW